MKKVILALTVIFIFFINFNVMAADNPVMVIDKKPNPVLTTSQFQVIGSINPKSLQDSNGNLVCPNVYVTWNSPQIGQQGSSSMRSYVATFEYNTKTDNRDTADIINQSITSTTLVCKYKFDGPSSDDYEFSIHYDKASDPSSSKTKLTDCLYYNQNKNSPYYNSSDNYLAFTIYNDGTVGGAVGFGVYSAYTVSYAGGNRTTCPPYVSASVGSTYKLTPSDTATDWKLGTGDIKDATTQKSGFVNYLAYNNSNAPKIIVQKSNNGYKFYLQSSSSGFFGSTSTNEIKVNGIDNYKAAFDSGNESSYPTWINLATDGKTYTMSDTKDPNAKTNYICQQKITATYNLGEETVQDTCEDIFGPEFLKFLDNNVIVIIRLGIPLLLILFTTFDFAKVVFIDDKEGIQKATKRFGKRIVAAILIYLVPAILIWLVKIIGADKVQECAEYFNSVATETETQ